MMFVYFMNVEFIFYWFILFILFYFISFISFTAFHLCTDVIVQFIIGSLFKIDVIMQRYFA